MNEGFKYDKVMTCITEKILAIVIVLNFSIVSILRNATGTRLEAECGPRFDMTLPRSDMCESFISNE